MMTSLWARWILLSLIVITHQIPSTGAVEVGVNFGLMADNLPSATDVVSLLKRSNIPRVRLFQPHLNVLDALRGSSIEVSLGTTNQDLAKLASSPEAADEWVSSNVAPYTDVPILWVTAGNEVIPGPDAQCVLPAIRNLEDSLAKAGRGDIVVTTVVSTGVLGSSYPPSQGAFAEDTVQVLTNIGSYLDTKGHPLMINVYPYFSLVSDPENIALNFSLFEATTPSFTDQGRDYYNLFDATVDAFRAALVKAVGFEVGIIVSESGWPSAGNAPYATIENARIYNNNLKKHLLTKGTPRNPEQLIDGFIFALFNENKKPAGVEQNFGSFYPDMTPVYSLW